MESKKLLSYIIDRDFGFAPNPFNGYCTLATCKPKTRNIAKVGDWIVGIGGKNLGDGYRKLIYAMEVTEKLTFNEYWKDERFELKKPIMNGSLKRAYGDNIYFCEDGQWHQQNSHHSHEDGTPNEKNIKRDTSSNFVLISDHFYYFGDQAKSIPKKFDPYIIQGGSNHRRIENPVIIKKFCKWIQSLVEGEIEKNELIGFPVHFGKFKRYKGIK